MTNWLKTHTPQTLVIGAIITLMGFMTPPLIFAFYLASTLTSISSKQDYTLERVDRISVNQREIKVKVDTLWDNDQRRQERERFGKFPTTGTAPIGSVPFIFKTPNDQMLAALYGREGIHVP